MIPHPTVTNSPGLDAGAGQQPTFDDVTFKEAIATWVPADHVAENEWQEWRVNEDGSITITLPSTIAANLAEDLLHWHRIAEEWPCRFPKGWKRSSTMRENRRESVVYGNALETVSVMLGRREVRALMERVAELPTPGTKDSEG